MAVKLNIRNPSSWPRRGYVAIPWQPIARRLDLASPHLDLRGPTGTSLAAQIDVVDPADRERDTLVILLDREVPPGSDDYSQVVAQVEIKGGPPAAAGLAPQTAPAIGPEHPPADPPRGFKLANGKLEIWFNLLADTGDPSRNWFAGCATSVVVENGEMLDAFRQALFGWKGHDPEKRCLQIDRIRLPLCAWDERPHRDELMFNRPYTLLSQSAGPVRTSAAIASAPFSYRYRDPVTDKDHDLECRLHRIISVYRDSDYLMEELSVRGMPVTGGPGARPVKLRFAARYFAQMDMGLQPQLTRFWQVPDWFSVSCGWPPLQGYGFATDMHTTEFNNPPGDYYAADPGRRCRAFSWELGAGSTVNCLHLFKHGGHEELSRHAGHAWYEHIYKPLRAELAI